MGKEEEMRILHKLYANICGYFWLPCPNCKRMFGGHECIPFGKTKLIEGHAYCVCPECNKNPNVITETSLPIIIQGQIWGRDGKE